MLPTSNEGYLSTHLPAPGVPSTAASILSMPVGRQRCFAALMTCHGDQGTTCPTSPATLHCCCKTMHQNNPFYSSTLCSTTWSANIINMGTGALYA